MIEKNVILFLTFLKIEKNISHTYGHFKTNIRMNNNIKTHTHAYVQAETHTHTHTLQRFCVLRIVIDTPNPAL